LEPGKLPLQLLRSILAKVPMEDERVLVSGGVGEDAAAVSFGNCLLVAKTDPITFATDHIGWYAVNVNANDVAASGARPAWFLASVLLPTTWNECEAERLFDQLIAACRELGVTLVGGHTEVTYDLSRPIVVGCMLGEAGPQGIVRTAGAKPGDDIVLTKGIAIEGTALLAREAGQQLTKRGVDAALIARAKDLLFSPGISVVREAQVACQSTSLHSMHDPTEGGLATALLEVGVAADVGMRVDREAIPVLPETEAICKALGLDPLGLLASGALLITLAPAGTPALLSALRQAGIAAWRIGVVTEAAAGFKVHTPTGLQDLPQFARDEVARFFST